MPITSNNTAIMSRRQSFNGKGLTFIEVIFDNAITGTATTPDTKDSTFQKVRDAVLGGVVSGTTLLGQSYRLAAKATVSSVQEVKKSRNIKLLPEHMFYKSEEEDRGEPRSEGTEVPEDSQDKDLEAALETALEKLRRYKHTLRVSEEAAFTPSDEA